MDHIDRMQVAEDIELAANIDRIVRSAESGPDAREFPALCADCGDPIDRKRLEALPAARLCLRCQRELEQEP